MKKIYTIIFFLIYCKAQSQNFTIGSPNNIISEYEIYAYCAFNAQTDTWSSWEQTLGKIIFLKQKDNFPIIVIEFNASKMIFVIFDVDKTKENIFIQTKYDVIDQYQCKGQISHYIYETGVQEFYIFRPHGIVCFRSKLTKN